MIDKYLIINIIALVVGIIGLSLMIYIKNKDNQKQKGSAK